MNGVLDGDSAMQLIEASHALHRAAVALEGIGPNGHAGPQPRCHFSPNDPTSTLDGSGTGPTSAEEDVHAALAHVDAAALCARVTRPEPDRREARVDQIRQLDTDEGIADDLIKDIGLRIDEAALVMQGSLRLIHDPVAVQRIEGAVGLLDEITTQVRSLVLNATFSGG